jgi:hypothetical protein
MKKAISIRNVALMMATVRNTSLGERGFVACLALLRSPTDKFSQVRNV